MCGNTFKALKSNASYCSNSCKQQAQRDRREAVARGITIEQARVTIITPEQRKVLKTKTCKVCGKPFEYRSSKGIFCSDACQKKDQRLREKNNTSLLREKVTDQAKVIQGQSKIIETVTPMLPKPEIEKLWWHGLSQEEVQYRLMGFVLCAECGEYFKPERLRDGVCLMCRVHKNREYSARMSNGS